MLELNNIEVVYDHVVLVLKGVTLRVARGGIVALLGRQRCWQVHHPEGGLQPAAGRARGSHPWHDPA